MLKLYHLEHEGIEGYGEHFLKLVNSGLIEGSGCACNGRHRGRSVDGVGLFSCSHSSDVGVLPSKRCSAYIKKAADVVHLSGVATHSILILLTFSLPDLLIDLSDLHCDRSPHTDLRPIPLCLLLPLCSCANREALG